MNTLLKKILKISFYLLLIFAQRAYAEGKESRQEVLSNCGELKQCLTQLFPEITSLGHTLAQALQHPDFLSLYPEITLGTEQYLQELISLDQLIEQCQEILASSKFRQDEKTIQLLERILSEGYTPPAFNFYDRGIPETYLAAIAQTDIGKNHLKALLKKMKDGKMGGIFWPGDPIEAMGGNPAIAHIIRESMRLEGTPTGAIYHTLDRNIYFPNALALGEGTSLLFHEIIHATDDIGQEEGEKVKNTALDHEKELTKLVSSIKDSAKREEFLKNYTLWSKNTKTLLLPKALREKALAESSLSSEEIQHKFLKQLKELSSETQKDHFLKTHEAAQRITQQHTFVQEARAYNAQKIFEQELETQTALNKKASFSAQYGPYLKESRHGLITQKPDLFFTLVNHYHIDIHSLLGLYTLEELTEYSSLHAKSKSTDPMTRLLALSELRRIPLRTQIP